MIAAPGLSASVVISAGDDTVSLYFVKDHQEAEEESKTKCSSRGFLFGSELCGERDNMSKATGVDLRKTVKLISAHYLFSSKWFAMLGSLQHITDTAVAEHKTSQIESESLKTLWERNELTVRYLLEEGKLNLCLRLMIEFKSMQRQEMFAEQLAKAKAQEPAHPFDDLPTIKIKAALYEQCLGVLLSCAFGSVESLQTLDMPGLFDHLGKTLTFSLAHSEMVRSPDADRRQEVLSLHYIAAIFEKIEHLQVRKCSSICSQSKKALTFKSARAYLQLDTCHAYRKIASWI